MENQKEISFLPFHALNEFMLDEFRMKVIRQTFANLHELPEKDQASINKLTRKYVKVQGFRNSVKAPLGVKLKPFAHAFEKSPELVGATISAWAKLNHQLGQQVYELLASRNWELLPLDADRSRLPGFLTVWPGGDNYEVLHKVFFEMYPDSQADKDDISLMIVWVGGRLPYQFTDPETNIDNNSI